MVLSLSHVGIFCHRRLNNPLRRHTPNIVCFNRWPLSDAVAVGLYTQNKQSLHMASAFEAEKMHDWRWETTRTHTGVNSRALLEDRASARRRHPGPLARAMSTAVRLTGASQV